MNSHEEHRKQQEADARRQLGQSRSKSSAPLRKPFVAKGHDAYLKDAQDEKGMIKIITMSDGESHVGKMIARDKFTITIEVDIHADSVHTLIRRTFYKHAIESFERVNS